LSKIKGSTRKGSTKKGRWSDLACLSTRFPARMCSTIVREQREVRKVKGSTRKGLHSWQGTEAEFSYEKPCKSVKAWRENRDLQFPMCNITPGYQILRRKFRGGYAILTDRKPENLLPPSGVY